MTHGQKNIKIFKVTQLETKLKQQGFCYFGQPRPDQQWLQQAAYKSYGIQTYNNAEQTRYTFQ